MRDSLPINIRYLDPNIDEALVYVGSDFHLGHDREFIWKERGFQSVHDHDRQLSLLLQQLHEMEEINNISGAKDSNKKRILILLGDFAVGCSKEYALENLLNVAALFDEVYYVFGNHEGQLKRNLLDLGCPLGLLKTIPRHYHEMPNPIPPFYFHIKNIHFVGFELLWENVFDLNENIIFTHFPITVYDDSNIINLHGHIHSVHNLGSGGNIDIGVENVLDKSFRRYCVFNIQQLLQTTQNKQN